MGDTDGESIQFEEKRMTLRGRVTLTILMYILTFGAVIVVSILKDISLIDALNIFCIIFILTSPLLIFLFSSRERFVIYSNGFYAPHTLLGLILGKKFFVKFEDIIHIGPFYDRLLHKGVGWRITLKDGRQINLWRNTEIFSILKDSLGNRWEKIYSEIPYLSEKDRKRVKKECMKSYKEVFTWAFLVMISPFFVAIAGAILEYKGLMLLSIFFFSFSILFGGVIIWMHYFIVGRVKEIYSVITPNHPMYSFFLELHNEIPKTSKKEFLLGNPIEEAKRFTDEDWKKIMRILNKKYQVRFYASIVALVGFVGIDFLWLLPDYFLVVIFGFLSVSLFSLLWMRSIDRARAFINTLIEEEHRRKERIIPEWFKVRNSELKGIKFREKPVYSNEKWKKLFAHWQLDTPSIAAALFTGVAVMYGIEIVIIIGYPSYRSLWAIPSIFALALSLLSLYSFKKIIDANVIRLVLKYEEETGDRVVPNCYREIVNKWIKKYNSWA